MVRTDPSSKMNDRWRSVREKINDNKQCLHCSYTCVCVLVHFSQSVTIVIISTASHFSLLQW